MDSIRCLHGPLQELVCDEASVFTVGITKVPQSHQAAVGVLAQWEGLAGVLQEEAWGRGLVGDGQARLAEAGRVVLVGVYCTEVHLLQRGAGAQATTRWQEAGAGRSGVRELMLQPPQTRSRHLGHLLLKGGVLSLDLLGQDVVKPKPLSTGGEPDIGADHLGQASAPYAWPFCFWVIEETIGSKFMVVSLNLPGPRQGWWREDKLFGHVGGQHGQALRAARGGEGELVAVRTHSQDEALRGVGERRWWLGPAVGDMVYTASLVTSDMNTVGALGQTPHHGRHRPCWTRP